MPLPGRNANCASSNMLCLTILSPMRIAMSLFTILPIIGPTDIGLIVSVVVICPSFFGSPVTMLSFSLAGMFFDFMHSVVIFVRSLIACVGIILTSVIGSIVSLGFGNVSGTSLGAPGMCFLSSQLVHLSLCEFVCSFSMYLVSLCISFLVFCLFSYQ